MRRSSHTSLLRLLSHKTCGWRLVVGSWQLERVGGTGNSLIPRSQWPSFVQPKSVPTAALTT